MPRKPIEERVKCSSKAKSFTEALELLERGQRAGAHALAEQVKAAPEAHLIGQTLKFHKWRVIRDDRPLNTLPSSLLPPLS